MNKIDIDNYIEKSETCKLQIGEDIFVNPKVMLLILRSETGIKLNELKTYLDTKTITVTNRKIREKLHQEKVCEDINYDFELAYLKYLKKYVSISRNKTKELLKLIQDISYRNILGLKQRLKKYDIRINDSLYLYCEDAIRLLEPAIFNFQEFKRLTILANNLGTYLNASKTRDLFKEKNISHIFSYQTESLQIESLANDYMPGNIKLSKRQKEILEQRQLMDSNVDKNKGREYVIVKKR